MEKKYEKIFYRLSYKNYPLKKGLQSLFEKINYKLINYKYIDRYNFKNFKKFINLKKYPNSKKKLNKQNFLKTKQEIKGSDYLITIFQNN